MRVSGHGRPAHRTRHVMYRSLLISPGRCGRLHSFGLAFYKSDRRVLCWTRGFVPHGCYKQLFSNIQLTRPFDSWGRLISNHHLALLVKAKHKLVSYVCPASVSKIICGEKASHVAWPFIIRTMLVIHCSLYRCLCSLRLDFFFFFFTRMYGEWWSKEEEISQPDYCVSAGYTHLEIIICDWWLPRGQE